MVQLLLNRKEMADNNNINNNNIKMILQLRKLYGVLKEFIPQKNKTKKLHCFQSLCHLGETIEILTV